MKKIRVVLSLLLIALICAAWLLQISRTRENNQAYRSFVTEADRLREEKLYQQALASYEKAKEIKDNSEVREKWIVTYELAYLDGVATERDYSKALSQMCDKQPKDAIYWEKQIQLCIENGSYTAAHDYLKKAARAGAKSELLEQLDQTVAYSYTNRGKTCTEFYRSVDGYYTIFDGKNWGVISPDGEWAYERVYFYASPMNATQDLVVTSSRDTRVLDRNGVVQCVFNCSAEQMRAPSENLIPMRVDGTWGYYDYMAGKMMLAGYDDVSSFQNGVAAVRVGKTWQLIDKTGNSVSDMRFDDIKLHSSGNYAYDGIMIAAANGNYGIYGDDGTLLHTLPCKDADAYYGETIAYQDGSGKWGFADDDGEIVIEPIFDEAKSFSSGMAAVRIGEQWGFIETTGKLVIENQYCDADYFTRDGVVMVSEAEGQYYVIQLRFPK